jgi:hypothetical protein
MMGGGQAGARRPANMSGALAAAAGKHAGSNKQNKKNKKQRKGFPFR